MVDSPRIPRQSCIETAFNWPWLSKGILYGGISDLLFCYLSMTCDPQISLPVVLHPDPLLSLHLATTFSSFTIISSWKLSPSLPKLALTNST